MIGVITQCTRHTFPPRQSIKNEGGAPGASHQGRKRDWCSFQIAPEICWVFPCAQILHHFSAHPQLLQRGRFFTKMGDEQWLRGVTKTGGLPPDKLWNWQHMLAFGQLTIPIVALSITYCTVTIMQNVDIYELFSQATCWLFMQSTLLTGQAGDVWVCLRIWSQRHWSAWVVCSPVCLYCRTQPHLSQQPTRLHIVLNEHHAPLPPLCAIPEGCSGDRWGGWQPSHGL